MAVKIFSGTISGLGAEIVEVEVEVSQGLPNTLIIGLIDTSIRESKERVRAAFKSTTYKYPLARVIVNLAPANIYKYGTHFDLPIALGILLASKQAQFNYNEWAFFGELSLQGQIKPANGVLSFVIAAKTHRIKKVFVPVPNLAEAELVKNIEIYAVNSLTELLDLLINNRDYSPPDHKILREEENYKDFKEIVGQSFAKRGMEIAVAGGHNILLKGIPGVGKTLLAESLPSIMPALSTDQLLEVVQIYSIGGFLNKHRLKPFRNPNRSISQTSFIGGGRIPKPGEISLAHNGVLFLDEFPEFPRALIESLREPLESGTIKISRAQGSYLFPAKFIFVAAQNPCPCGYYQSDKTCTCSIGQINLYKKKISGPILERIDLQVNVEKVDILKVETAVVESSSQILYRVTKARDIQIDRANLLNAKMDNNEINKHCALNSEASMLIKAAHKKYDFSARTYFRILRVARTIADLAQSENISVIHLAEAIQYRLGD
ncbi:MAG: Mg chelatase, subunit ChlI [Candidatus Doudnabacteria bacterium]|nr:Mg chelatase, subunit ChlI [Candidatus Doudnabacteria bacterium]